MIWIILYMILIGVVRAYQDAYVERYKTVSHSANMMLGTIVLTGMVLIKYSSFIAIDNLNAVFWTITGSIAPYWITFDILKNIVLKKKWYYLGNANFLDRLGFFNWLLKLIFLGFTLFTLIEYYK